MNQIGPYVPPPHGGGMPGHYPVPAGGMPHQGAVPDIYRQGGQLYPYYPNFDTAPDASGGIDFYKYLRIAMKYRWLIASIIAGALLLATAFTLLATPVYRATSSIQIDREAMSIVKVEGVQAEQNTGNDFYQTQYEMLASRSLAERVATTLGLADNARFNAKESSLLDTLKGVVLGRKEAADQDVSQEDRASATVNNVKSRVAVQPVRGSRIVRISVDHSFPDVAQNVANGYAEVFIADNLDRRFDATSYARKFLEDRLQQLKVRLEESEKQLVKYAEEQGIISLENNRNLSSADLEAINTKLAEARSERVKAELQWKQAQRTGGLGLKQILDSPAIQENRKIRAQLAAQYQQKLAVFKPAFPDMVQLRNQIRELDRQVQSEVEAVKQSIEASFLAAKGEEDQLQTSLENVKSDVVDQRNRSIQYNILQREVDTNRSLYDGLLQRYKEIGVAGGVGTNNISIVDRAIMPTTPISPNLSRNLLMAFLIGLVLSCAMAMLLDYLDDSFKAPEDIERELSLPVVGIVPKPSQNGEAGIADELLDPRSAMSEAYRSLRTGLQFATSNGLPRTLLITSSKPSEGKTTTTIQLARALSQIGLNVLLIDGDLRKAAVHVRLECMNESGLSNVLSGSMQPEDVVQETDFPNLVVMTSGPLPPNPAELLSGPKMPWLLAMAAESFDIVLIDGPPIMGLADAPLLSTVVQSTMLVVAANETRKNVVRTALKRLQMARANVIGALLNKFDAKQVGYGYGYGYGEFDYHNYGGKNVPAIGDV
jgi:polysaccharide biosynthesis transport protein